MTVALVLREATAADMPAVAEIYGHWVRVGLGSFEESPPDAAEMAARRERVVAAGGPYWVALSGGALVGYAYAGPYRTRAAYRWTAETSVYIAPEAQGRGVGAALLDRLISECAPRGWRQMVAVIGDSGNAASRRLHARAGFEEVGVLPSVGFKFGRWVDVVLMQRPLGPGDATPPE